MKKLKVHNTTSQNYNSVVLWANASENVNAEIVSIVFLPLGEGTWLVYYY